MRRGAPAARGAARAARETRAALARSACFIALAFLASAGCASRPAAPVDLTILSTNDFHGALESRATDRDTKRPLGGAAYVVATIDSLRAIDPAGTLVLDGGDIYQGTALSNLTQGRATIEYMNAAGFDAAAIGNHEFDWGVPTLVERIGQARFPMLVANMVEKATGRAPAWATPYTILRRKGVRVAVIGLITPSTPMVTMPENVEPYTFLDPAEVANRLIGELVPRRADIAVIACHIGGRQDSVGTITGEVAEMARAIDGEAAIVSGHTHSRLEGTIDGVPVVQALSSGRYLGRIDLLVDRAARRVIEGRAAILPVFADSVAPDREVVAMIERERGAVEQILEEVLGEAAVPLTTERRECPMGNLVSDVMREVSGAAFAFTNPGGLRAPIDEGPITYSEVYEVLPFDNTMVVYELTGAEVIRLLEQGAEGGGFLHASGIRYTLDRTKPSGSRITAASRADGSPITPETIYPAAVNSFMAQGGDGLAMLVDHPRSRETGIVIRESFADWIRAQTKAGRKVTAAVDGRINRIGD